MGNIRQAVADIINSATPSPIKPKWLSMGGAAGTLGQPYRLEQPIGAGRFTVFTKAAIYWLPNTGAYAVLPDIAAAYQDAGGPTGTWGFPTSDQFTNANGQTEQDFEHAFVTWSSAGNVTVHGVIITPDTTSIAVGEAAVLQANVSPVTWASNDTSVATVTAAGVVRGVSPGTTTVTATTSSGTFGVATVSVRAAPHVTRMGGRDRYETAIEIARQGWTKANTVVLAYGGNFPDALAGTPLAAALDAPILLTKTDKTPPDVLAELDRLRPRNIILLGSATVISQQQQAELTSLGYTVTRYGGATRYDTAKAISDALASGAGFGRTWVPSSTMILATGENYPDALAVGSYAGANLMPIMFSTAAGLPKQTADFIRSQGITDVIAVGAARTQVVLAGLAGAGISSGHTQLIYGDDRYATSVAIATTLFGTQDVRGVSAAVGTNFPDALTGAALSAREGFPILLINPKTGATPDEQTYVRAITKAPWHTYSLYVFGSTAALSGAAIATLS